MSLNRFLSQSVSYQNPSDGMDKHGNPSMGTAVTCRARFERINQSVITAQGDRVPVHGRVFTPANESILIGAKITYDSEIYKVMTREDVVVGDGSLHHRELLVQEWNFS